jgi:hypothetical protein
VSHFKSECHSPILNRSTSVVSQVGKVDPVLASSLNATSQQINRSLQQLLEAENPAHEFLVVLS